jgi:hypothetical protein
MKTINNIILILTSSILLFFLSCGGGGDIEPIPTYGCTDSTASNYNPLATIDDSSCCYLYGCTDSIAYNYNPCATIDDSSCVNVVGDWLFNANCEEYILGTDTIFLDDELPDSITILSNSSDNLFIEAGSNTLNATIDVNGDFIIEYQSFKTYLEIGPIADTATIYLTGTGNFISQSEGSMDLTFTEPNLPGEINCSILLSKID